MSRVKAKWMGYSAFAVPPDANEHQQAAVRNAFYAGAIGILELQFPANSIEELEEIMVGITTELYEHIERVIKDVVNGNPV